MCLHVHLYSASEVLSASRNNGVFPCATKLICYCKELYVRVIKYVVFITAVSLCHLSGTCSECHKREIVLVYLIPKWIVSPYKSDVPYLVPIYMRYE